MTTEEEAHEAHDHFESAQDVVARVKPLFAGRHAQAQGAALAELTALFLAGHHPALREEIKRLHFEYVEKLIPVMENEIFPNGVPDEWKAA